jgi:hypothetical protein
VDIGEGPFVGVLAAANLFLGFGLGIPVARCLRLIDGQSRRLPPYFIVVVGVYLSECVAFAAGMATQVFSLGLALVWGLVLGFWLPPRTSARKGAKIALSLAAYSTLPTVSFCTILPVAFSLGRQSVLSIEDGLRFGLPRFLPWPLTTVLGFCVALALSTLLAKMAVTAGATHLLLRLRPSAEANDTQHTTSAT